MQVSVLGSVGVRRDGAGDVELGARLRRLLAVLAVANGSVVSTDRLVDIVWAGQPPAGADKTLRSYVTRLRQALDADRDELIVFRQPGYALERNPDRRRRWRAIPLRRRSALHDGLRRLFGSRKHVGGRLNGLTQSACLAAAGSKSSSFRFPFNTNRRTFPSWNGRPLISVR